MYNDSFSYASTFVLSCCVDGVELLLESTQDADGNVPGGLDSVPGAQARLSRGIGATGNMLALKLAGVWVK